MVLLKRKFWIFLQFTCFLIVVIFFFNYSYLLSVRKKPRIIVEELKDWNDYEIIREDSLRTGFGEHGKGEKLTDANEIEENKKLFAEFGANALISDKISVNRSIPEFRHPKCLEKRYFKHLPKVSIIIIFVDEIFSVFKRTLHSLYNRTPHELIEEVILVNDHSTKEYLYVPLKKYIEENFSGIKFHIINLKKRHGLMKARVVGAKAAKSEFLFIMEPHCEITYNWLPPLLQPLVYDERVVTVPIIDNIEWKALDYYENDRGNLGSRGIFDWTLEYEKLPRLPIDKEKELEPFPIPVMTGGIFMIRKSYFFEIGPYDPALEIWGAENIEMSLKINLCGGKLLEVPCSHIGHMFRAFTNSRKHESGMDFEGYNRKRIVEVWFDEYKEFVYARQNRRYQIDAGDLTEAKKFKQKMNCKPFKYFLTDVAPDLIENFPPEQIPFAYGQIQLLDTDLCFTTDYEGDPEKDYHAFLDKCTNPIQAYQDFELSWFRSLHLVLSDMCVDAYGFTITPCHYNGGNQHFKYDIRTKQIINVAYKQCVESKDDYLLNLAKCDETLPRQRWIFTEYMNETALNDWRNSGRPLPDGEGIFW